MGLLLRGRILVGEILGTKDEWPTGPSQIEKRRLGWYLRFAGELALTILPISFIILAILAAKLDGQPLSNYGQNVVDATRLGPSIYPIIFTAVASRFYRSVALWTAARPRGISIGALEQLLGSQSFAGTVVRLLEVRTHIILGLLIFSTWALSPVGGQSSSRLIETASNVTTDTATIYHSSTDGLTALISASDKAVNQAAVNTLYSASLLASGLQKQSRSDMWSRPKIPHLLPAYRFPRNSTTEYTWQHVDAAAMQADSYASLLGIKVQGMRDLAAQNNYYNFTAEASYADFDCALVGHDMPINASILTFLNVSDYEPTLRANMFVPKQPNATERSSFFMAADVWRWNRAGRLDSALHVVYGSKSTNANDVYSLFNCTVHNVAVELNIGCSAADGCGVTRLRLSQNATWSPPTLMAWTQANPGITNLLSAFPLAAGFTDRYSASPTDNFVRGSTEFPYATWYPSAWAGVPLADVSRRLTTAFNTFFLASLDPLQATNASVTADPQLPGPSQDSGADMRTATATVATATDVYRLNRAWAGVLLASTGILMVLAVLGLVLRAVTAAPDILDYASSLTRENPHLPPDCVPPGGTAMGGAERARRLRGLRVQIADVAPRDDVGYIALTGATGARQGKAFETERMVRRGRQYW